MLAASNLETVKLLRFSNFKTKNAESKIKTNQFGEIIEDDSIEGDPLINRLNDNVNAEER